MISTNLRISEVIQAETVDLHLSGVANKDELLKKLVGMLYKARKITSPEEFLQAVYERESLGPTYMENFIAIPHGKSKAVLEPGIAFGRSVEGIYYETDLGGGIAKLIFLLAIPDQLSPDQYMRVLSRIARLLVHDEFRESLYEVSTYAELVTTIERGEALLEENS